MNFYTKYFIFILIAFFAVSCYSQEIGTANSEFLTLKNRKDWNFKIAPYAWLAGMSTNVGGEKITQSFNDLSSLTNFGFQIAVGVNYKKWSFSSNATIAKLGANETLGPIDIDLKINQLILDNKINYLLIDRVDMDDNIIRGWTMDVNLGAIYWLNAIDVGITYPIDIPGLPKAIDDNQEWVDLVTGVNIRIILSKSVYLGLSANVGGFGISNSSDLYWDITYINTFKVSKLLTVVAGYKTFNYKRTDGTGDEVLKTAVQTFGPLLGLTVHL